MNPGVYCNKTYEPVAGWDSIMILLSTVLHNNWKMTKIDYVLSFTKAPVERECYMNTPNGIGVHSDTEWVIKSKKNISGKCHAGKVWNKFLVERYTS